SDADQPRVGIRKAIDQDGHERAVEFVAADVGGPVQVVVAYADDARSAHGDHIGAAHAALQARDIGHLAETFAGVDDVQQPALLDHLHFARGEQAEEISPVAFVHQNLARLAVFPAAYAHHFPQLGVAEIGKERQAAQSTEFFAVGEIVRYLRRFLA